MLGHAAVLHGMGRCKSLVGEPSAGPVLHLARYRSTTATTDYNLGTNWSNPLLARRRLRTDKGAFRRDRLDLNRRDEHDHSLFLDFNANSQSYSVSDRTPI